MTNDQFDALVKLMRGKPDSLANQAARAVLVGSLSQAEAMRQYGVTRSTVGDAVRRYADAHALLQRAYATGNEYRHGEQPHPNPALRARPAPVNHQGLLVMDINTPNAGLPQATPAGTPKRETKEDYPALECPLCDRLTKPRSLNKDGSVTYSCPADHVHHGNRYTWRITVDGALMD